MPDRRLQVVARAPQAMLIAVAVAVSLCATAEASALSSAMPLTERAAQATATGCKAVTQLVGRLQHAAKHWLRDRESRRDTQTPPTLGPMAYYRGWTEVSPPRLCGFVTTEDDLSGEFISSHEALLDLPPPML